MAERGDASRANSARDDRETLLEIARQITGTDPLPHGGEPAPRDADGAFEDAAEGMALCAGGEITYANSSFALAFGYPSPEALMEAGGLSAIFPGEKDGIGPGMAANGGARRVLDAMTRSRRQVKMPVAMHAVDGDAGEPAVLLVLHPDAADVETAARESAAPPEDGKPAAREGRGVDPSPAAQTNAPPPKAPGKARKKKPAGETDFLARVSHDIRTPLNSIIGFAELMKAESDGPLGGERYRGYVRDILESGEYALGLIDDLLVISRIETGAFELNFASVDLNGLAGECLAAAQPHANGKRVFLRAALGESLPPVLADRPTLERIVTNLLRNAVTSSNPGGQVILESRVKRSGAVRLRVQDCGGGMSQAEIARAMQPFRQSDTAPRVKHGNGLALPLTRALARANRAKFRLDSAPGRGTRVSIVFPARRTAAR